MFYLSCYRELDSISNTSLDELSFERRGSQNSVGTAASSDSSSGSASNQTNRSSQVGSWPTLYTAWWMDHQDIWSANGRSSCLWLVHCWYFKLSVILKTIYSLHCYLLPHYSFPSTALTADDLLTMWLLTRVWDTVSARYWSRLPPTIIVVTSSPCVAQGGGCLQLAAVKQFFILINNL